MNIKDLTLKNNLVMAPMAGYTDWPFRKIHVVRAMFEASLPDDISPADMELFMGGNLRKLFRIG